MKKFRNLLLATIGLVVFALLLSQSSPGRVIARQAQECIKICDEVPLSTIVRNVIHVIGDVKITNDSDSPIPTRVNGTIQIASSTRDAVRTKPVLQVTDVFQREVKIILEPNEQMSTASFNVPQSRLLVIEGWTGSAQMGQPLQFPQVLIKTTGNGMPVTAPVFGQPVAGGWALNHLGWGFKLYADPDSTVEVRFARSSTAGTATMTLSLSGHYIDQ